MYTNLEPGSYRFYVRPSNMDGLWNGAEAVLLFKVDPAFFQAWWFRLGESSLPPSERQPFTRDGSTK